MFSSIFVPKTESQGPENAHHMARPIQVVVDDGYSLNPGAAPVTSSLLSVSGPADPHADDDIIYPYAFSRIASHHLSHQMQLSQDCLTLDPKPEFAWPQIQSQGYAWARSKEGIRPNAGIVRWQVRLNKTSATNQEDFWVGVATVTATLASPNLRQKEMWVFGNYQAHKNGNVSQNYHFARGDVVTLELERRARLKTAEVAVNTLRIRVDGKPGMEMADLPERAVLFPVFYLSSRCSYTIIPIEEDIAPAARADAEAKAAVPTSSLSDSADASDDTCSELAIGSSDRSAAV